MIHQALTIKQHITLFFVLNHDIYHIVYKGYTRCRVVFTNLLEILDTLYQTPICDLIIP